MVCGSERRVRPCDALAQPAIGRPHNPAATVTPFAAFVFRCRQRLTRAVPQKTRKSSIEDFEFSAFVVQKSFACFGGNLRLHIAGKASNRLDFSKPVHT